MTSTMSLILIYQLILNTGNTAVTVLIVDYRGTPEYYHKNSERYWVEEGIIQYVRLLVCFTPVSTVFQLFRRVVSLTSFMKRTSSILLTSALNYQNISRRSNPHQKVTGLEVSDSNHSITETVKYYQLHYIILYLYIV